MHEPERLCIMGKMEKRGWVLDRTAYAMSREVVTRADDGHNQFNVSELAGNFVSAGIFNAYYPAPDRTFPKTFNKWGSRLRRIRSLTS